MAVDLAVHFGPLACSGVEDSITSCLPVATMASTISAPHNHSNDVFIVCLPKNHAYSGNQLCRPLWQALFTPSKTTNLKTSLLCADVHVAGQQAGDVRLFGPVLNGQGAVEIFTEQLGWTAICPENWDNSHARAVCQALGYDTGITETFQ